MMQPCPICLHLISLVALAQDQARAEQAAYLFVQIPGAVRGLVSCFNNIDEAVLANASL